MVLNLKKGDLEEMLGGHSFQRVVRHWRRLPREAVDAPSLEALEARLDGALRSLIWWAVILLMAGAWNWTGIKVPSNQSHSVIL